MARDGLEFQEEGERGETEEDDEAHDAIEEGGGETGGLARGLVAAKIEGAHGVTTEPAEEKGVVEISDPRGDVGPVQRERDALGAEQQPPAPRLERKGETGDERGEDDGRRGEVAPQRGELAPVDTPDEGGDEERGEPVARGAAGGGVEESEEAARHCGGA